MTTKQKITYCLWLNNEAEEAADFYTTVFENIKITETVRNPIDTPSGKTGSVLTVSFDLEGQEFMLLNGGPQFKINPSISFFLNFDPSKNEKAGENLENIWEKFADNGKVFMELGEYPFSPKYGWIQDKFGVTWQLMLTNPEGDDRPFVVPSLLFCDENTNKAEKAMQFYTDVFSNSKTGNLARYPKKLARPKKVHLMYGDFIIENTWLAMMDSGTEQDFTFNEAVSLMVSCENQDEIDNYWEELSAVPEAEACGWLKDKYGVSWQIVPNIVPGIFQNEDREKAKRAMQAMMEMKKMDIAKLKNA